MTIHNRSQPNHKITTVGSSSSSSKMESLYHTHDLAPNQCTSLVSQTIDAPLPLVWSVVRRFDNPQAYKQMVRTCDLSSGDGRTGSIREVTLMSGLPAGRSTERLHSLDDDLHLMKFDIIGGDHKLVNYRSTTTLHEAEEGSTVVLESFVVDVPDDSSVKDTCLFADTIIGCNLKSLARISEKMAVAFAMSLK